MVEDDVLYGLLGSALQGSATLVESLVGSKQNDLPSMSGELVDDANDLDDYVEETNTTPMRVFKVLKIAPKLAKTNNTDPVAHGSRCCTVLEYRARSRCSNRVCCQDNVERPL